MATVALISFIAFAVLNGTHHLPFHIGAPYQPLSHGLNISAIALAATATAFTYWNIAKVKEEKREEIST
ncbi:MAG: hypothetical protein KBC64_02330 [Simkaniaceae bacterium]|nr:hypothetical protein [Simkaniaceae bacterium]